MAIKGYSAFPKVSALLEPHYKIVYRHIQDTSRESSTPLQRRSRCILQPQLTWPFFLKIASVMNMIGTEYIAWLLLKCFFKDWWICNYSSVWFSCLFHITSELYYLGEKINTVKSWKFYPEQHHSDVTWNEFEKHSVLQLQIHPFFKKRLSTVNSRCVPFQAIIVTLKKKKER